MYTERNDKVKYIVIHHSQTEDKNILDWEAIRKYHIEINGWIDIGYQYGCEIVDNIPIIQFGRPEWAEGAHCIGRNNDSIGICVVGNYDVTLLPDALFNKTVELVTYLCDKYKLSEQSVVTHNQFASYKTCPGIKFPMDGLRNAVKDNLKNIELLNSFINYLYNIKNDLIGNFHGTT